MMPKEDFQRILEHGFRYGHTFNPQYPELQNLSLNDLQKLDQDHRLAKQLVASVQASDGALLKAAFAFHGRALMIDGDPGPATLQLIDVPRCGCPDWGPESGNELPATEAAGSGSWIAGCFLEFPGIHAVTYGIEVGKMQPMWRDNLNYLLGAITKSENEIGFHPIFVDVTANPRVVWTPSGWVLMSKILSSAVINCYAAWIGLGGSTIGINNVPSSFRCGMTISGKIDVGYSPSGESGLRKLGRLKTHEDGHGKGKGHYSSTSSTPSIMNPSIEDGLISWVGDRLESVMRGNFAGSRIDPWGTLTFPGWSHDEWT